MSEIKIIIQARTGSTRLPQKMILPFYGDEGVFSLILNRITNEIDREDVILATSVNPNNDVLEQIACEHGIKCYRGSENDVLQRFIDAATEFGAKRIIRVCADNPFLDIEYLKILIENFENSDADYLAYSTSTGWPTIKTHYGFWAEAVTLNALRKVKELTDESLYHEHVTNFIYANPEIFNVQFMKIPMNVEKHDNIRLTMDTQADFDMQKEIFNEIYSRNKKFNAEDVVSYLVENQHYFEKMKIEIEKNRK